MSGYRATLRYYPGDPLEEIRQEKLDRIAADCGVEVSWTRIDNRTPSDAMLREETLDRPLEEISQDVITVKADDDGRLRQALEQIYQTYRAPRTPYSFFGSTIEGERIAKVLADQTGGGW